MQEPIQRQNGEHLVFTLVHGTFDSEKIWINADSPFSISLKNSLAYHHGTVIKAFEWSGQNTLFARLLAQGRLRRQLHQSLKNYPQSKHICVGYSHGGSVVSYALNDPILAKSVSGVVFLATPFIYCRPRKADLLDPLLALLGFVFVTMLSYALSSKYGSTALHWAILLFVPFSLLAACLRKYVAERTRWSHSVAERIPPQYSIHSKALLIRSPGDEASGLLSSAAFLSWLQASAFDLFYSIAERLKQWDEKIRSKPTLPEGPSHPWGPILGMLRAIIPIGAYILTGLVAAVAIPTSMISGLPFGFDLACHAPFLEMNVDSFLPVRCSARQVRPLTERSFVFRSFKTLVNDWPLAHRMHEHPDVPGVIADWIRELLRINP